MIEPRMIIPPGPMATFHSVADLFPLMQGIDFDALVEDVRLNGLKHPIVEYQNAILDGRNRYLACLKALVKPRYTQFTGSDPVAYVMSTNLHRRHLNVSQRAMIAARLATMTQGRRTDLAHLRAPVLEVSRADAARILHVSTRSLSDARRVQSEGIPELIDRVEAGFIDVKLAARAARLPASQQLAIANEADPAIAKGAIKRASRDQREVDLAQATAAAAACLGVRLYGVIVADPPWRFEPWSRTTGMDRAADNHYPTMTVDDIAALDPPAAEDCVLFLWATPPMLVEALNVMAAWDFEYKTHFVWRKPYAITGYWVRGKHELLLIGTRGEVAAPAPGTQFDSVIDGDPMQQARRHSAKPDAFLEIVEQMFPAAAKLEMFARSERAGWDQWGNQMPVQE